MKTTIYFKPLQRGFTLVELMIVVAIIAILAAVGLSVFSGIQKKARDAARRSDVQAIAKVLETNKKDTGYQALAAAQFAGGVIPTKDAQNLSYCVNGTTANSPQTAVSPNATTCATAGMVTPSITAVPSDTSKAWTICAWLEETGAAYCLSNQQ